MSGHGRFDLWKMVGIRFPAAKGAQSGADETCGATRFLRDAGRPSGAGPSHHLVRLASKPRRGSSLVLVGASQFEPVPAVAALIFSSENGWRTSFAHAEKAATPMIASEAAAARHQTSSIAPILFSCGS